MEITNEILNNLTYQKYRKIAPVQVRTLTEEDYQQRQGVVFSLEGPVRFQPGDYLAKGILDEEWAMSQEGLLSNYEYVTGPNEQGFTTYRPKSNVRWACQMPEPFSIRRRDGTILKGKAGDYLIRLEDRARIVDRTVFEKSHERIFE